MPHRMYVQVDPITRRYAHMPLGSVDTGVDLSKLTTESRKGIDYLTDASVATVSAALSFLDLGSKLESPVSVVYSLAPATSGAGSARSLDDVTKAGFAVIVSKGKAIPTVIVTKNPAVVVDSARSGGAGAVFRIPAGLADAAAAALLATIPNDKSPATPAKMSLLPALAIGGVAVALVVGVLAMKPGAKTGMKPNGRRRALRRNTGKDPQYTLVQLKNDPMIRMVVGNYHVGTPDAEIERYFRDRCAKAGYSKSFADKMVNAALFHHHKNRALYSHVMGGMKSRARKLKSNLIGIAANRKRKMRANSHHAGWFIDKDGEKVRINGWHAQYYWDIDPNVAMDLKELAESFNGSAEAYGWGSDYYFDRGYHEVRWSRKRNRPYSYIKVWFPTSTSKHTGYELDDMIAAVAKGAVNRREPKRGGA